MLKKSLMLLLMVSVTIAALPQWVAFNPSKPAGSPLEIQVLSANPAQITIHISIPGMWVKDTTVDGATYQRISIPGTHGTLNQIGRPELPRIARYFALPPSSGTVVKEGVATMQTLSDYLVFPEQFCGPEGSSGDFQIDPLAYAQDSYSPIQAESLGVPGVMRNIRMGKVFFCPLRYNPVQRILNVVPEIDLTLSLEGIDTRNDIPGFPSAVDPQIDVICRSLALGYDGVYSGASILSSQDNTYGKYYYVIAAQTWWDSRSTNGLDEYLEWLRHRGYKVETATVGPGDDVYDVWDMIVDWYDDYPGYVPRHVLLVGDAPEHSLAAEFGGLCPDDLVQHCSNTRIATYGCYPCNTPIPGYTGTTWSDYLYCLMPPYDDTPDIAVGRWCPHSDTALHDIIYKQFAYEHWIDEDWTMQEVLFVGGEGGFWNAKEAILTSDWWHESLFPHSVQYTLETKADAKAAIRDNLNNNGGVSIVNYRGHGNCYSWDSDRLDPLEAFRDWVQGSIFSYVDIYGLDNEPWHPLVFSVCCLTGCITAIDHESMVEAWTNSEHGAVGALGASRMTNTDRNNDLDSLLFEGFFDPDIGGPQSNVKLDVGYAINYAKEKMREKHGFSSGALQDARAYRWVGDPGLRPWYGGLPMANYIQIVPPSIPINTEVDITVELMWVKRTEFPPLTLYGADVAANVGLYKVDGEDDQDTIVRSQWTSFYDEDPDDDIPPVGFTTFANLEFTTPGQLYITATRQTDEPLHSPWPMNPHEVTIQVGGGYFSQEADVEETVEPIKWSLTCTPAVSSGRILFNYSTPQVGGVFLKIYDASGRMVKGFSREHEAPGHYEFAWDGNDQNNLQLPDGVYFFIFGGQNYHRQGKVTVLR